MHLAVEPQLDQSDHNLIRIQLISTLANLQFFVVKVNYASS